MLDIIHYVLLGFGIFTFFAIVVILWVTVIFRRKFNIMFPGGKMSYNLIITSFVLFAISQLLTIIFRAMNPFHRDKEIVLLFNSISFLAVLLYAWGWYRILNITIGAKMPWSHENVNFNVGIRLLFDSPSKLVDTLPLFKLILTRDPWKFKEEENVYWITKSYDGDRHVSPTNLEKMGHIISTFMKASEDEKVVIIDGIEYLILENGFNRVFKWLTNIHDIARTTNTMVLIPLDREVLEKRELALFKREFREY